MSGLLSNLCKQQVRKRELLAVCDSRAIAQTGHMLVVSSQGQLSCSIVRLSSYSYKTTVIVSHCKHVSCLSYGS